jgi:hypothetical protein
MCRLIVAPKNAAVLAPGIVMAVSMAVSTVVGIARLSQSSWPPPVKLLPALLLRGGPTNKRSDSLFTPAFDPNVLVPCVVTETEPLNCCPPGVGPGEDRL